MSQISGVPYVEPDDFDYVVGKARDFFRSRGFKECHLQNLLTILAACEDPSTVSTFEYVGNVYPLPQTNQIIIEV